MVHVGRRSTRVGFFTFGVGVGYFFECYATAYSDYAVAFGVGSVGLWYVVLVIVFYGHVNRRFTVDEAVPRVDAAFCGQVYDHPYGVVIYFGPAYGEGVYGDAGRVFGADDPDLNV